MKLDEITYDLPKERIALHPPKNRGESRLLVLNKESGAIQDSLYKQLADHLKPGDLLVLNNTRVLPARLLCKTESGLERELLLLEKHGSGGKDDGYGDHHRSKVMYRGKLKSGQQLFLDEHSITIDKLNDDGTAEVSSQSDLWDLAEAKGHVPLPPYMHRPDSAEDRRRYQTVFAKEKGSVAAPTASLNMTDQLMTELKQQGINIAELTLHVGLGTFMPIRVEDVTKHKMHQEYFELPASTIEAIRSTKEKGGRVVAVGTTVARTLEYAAGEILSSSIKRNTITGEADIFIYPGYEFKVIDGLLTNYHAPDSTVLMMAAAYAGPDNLLKAYEHALSKDYTFLSYGDSMLII
jgi:S-adenosylmethionine:tRNA ribosyltransferase-isomerase